MVQVEFQVLGFCLDEGSEGAPIRPNTFGWVAWGYLDPQASPEARPLRVFGILDD